jgi:DNA-binding NarL/FixJ family response regulator
MPLRILLADDASAVLERVKAFLQAEGFDVVGAAADGDEAVHLAQALDPDVAILDLSMPRLSGLDAALRIHARCPRTRVILLTMHNHLQHITRALDTGILGYVVKCDIVEDLPRAIREVSDGRVFLSVGAARVFIDSHMSRPDRPVATLHAATDT